VAWRNSTTQILVFEGGILSTPLNCYDTFKRSKERMACGKNAGRGSEKRIRKMAIGTKAFMVAALMALVAISASQGQARQISSTYTVDQNASH
jgi:hypothetical protein